METHDAITHSFLRLCEWNRLNLGQEVVGGRRCAVRGYERIEQPDGQILGGGCFGGISHLNHPHVR